MTDKEKEAPMTFEEWWHNNGNGVDDYDPTVERGYAEKAWNAALAARPSTDELAHRKAVGAFLSELYAITVDPLADGTIRVEEMCAALLTAAKEQRDLLAANPVAPSFDVEEFMDEFFKQLPDSLRDDLADHDLGEATISAICESANGLYNLLRDVEATTCRIAESTNAD